MADKFELVQNKGGVSLPISPNNRANSDAQRSKSPAIARSEQNIAPQRTVKQIQYRNIKPK